MYLALGQIADCNPTVDPSVFGAQISWYLHWHFGCETESVTVPFEQARSSREPVVTSPREQRGLG